MLCRGRKAAVQTVSTITKAVQMQAMPDQTVHTVKWILQLRSDIGHHSKNAGDHECSVVASPGIILIAEVSTIRCNNKRKEPDSNSSEAAERERGAVLSDDTQFLERGRDALKIVDEAKSPGGVLGVVCFETNSLDQIIQSV